MNFGKIGMTVFTLGMVVAFQGEAGCPCKKYPREGYRMGPRARHYNHDQDEVSYSHRNNRENGNDEEMMDDENGHMMNGNKNHKNMMMNGKNMMMNGDHKNMMDSKNGNRKNKSHYSNKNMGRRGCPVCTPQCCRNDRNGEEERYHEEKRETDESPGEMAARRLRFLRQNRR